MRTAIVRALPLLALVWGSLGCEKKEEEACSRPDIKHTTGIANHHVEPCTTLCGNGENPPTGGPHCPTWVECFKYPLESGATPTRCNWIHNMEHGHVVLAYNPTSCPDGCLEIKAQLEAIYDAVPPDSSGRRRILVVPDDLIPQKVAAMVWGYAWSGDTVDAAAIECIMKNQDNAETPERGAPCNPPPL
jgi:hypothetical protein